MLRRRHDDAGAYPTVELLEGSWCVKRLGHKKPRTPFEG